MLYIIYEYNSKFLHHFVATIVVTGFTTLPAYYSFKFLARGLLYRKLIGKFISALLLAAFVNTVLTYFIAGAFYYKLSGKSICAGIAIIQVVFLSFLSSIVLLLL
jgi:hypothetical protein